jgi:hypothetical protein
VAEILHYTSQKGVQGSVMKWSVLSRHRLEDDEELAYIFAGVWPRRDPEWIDYVSLSVSRINAGLYDKSRKHYPDWWWAVMSFSPGILDHDGVWFTTTNNVYSDVCERGQGVEGFEQLFRQCVPWGYQGSVIVRGENTPAHWPTDRQAEVLYPEELSLDFLNRVYVPSGQHRALVLAWCEVFSRPEIEVEVNPAVFS